jgi:hypothetical protein
VLADTESYERFGIGGNAVAEGGTITPEANGAQYNLVFDWTSTVQDQGTVHAAIGADNETDSDMQIVILNL